MVDNISCFQGPVQALVIIHRPYVSTASLGLVWAERDMGAEGHRCLVYKYTWSIENCATWCNIPAPSSCCS